MDGSFNYPLPFRDPPASARLGCEALIKMSLNVTGVDGVGWERPRIASAGSTQLHLAGPWRRHGFVLGRDGGMGRDVLGGAFGMPSLGEAGVPGAAAPVLCELMIKCGLVLLQCPTRCSRCRIHPSSPVVSKHLSSIPSTTCPCRGTHRCAEQGCAVPCPAGSCHHPVLLRDPPACSVPHTSPSPLPSIGMPAVHKGLGLHSRPVLLSLVPWAQLCTAPWLCLPSALPAPFVSLAADRCSHSSCCAV